MHLKVLPRYSKKRDLKQVLGIMVYRQNKEICIEKTFHQNKTNARGVCRNHLKISDGFFLRKQLTGFCFANQLTGFYVMATLAFIELILASSNSIHFCSLSQSSILNTCFSSTKCHNIAIYTVCQQPPQNSTAPTIFKLGITILYVHQML